MKGAAPGIAGPRSSGAASRPGCSRPGPFRLLVFDWDGTLMDSIAAIAACTRVALRDAGCPDPPEATIRRAIGMGLRDSAALFFPEGSESHFQAMVERYRHHWLETYKDTPLLFAGAAAALRELGARGHLLAVATAKGRRGLERELEGTGLLPLLRCSRTVDECPPKPHPGMLLELMAEVGALPGQTLMIGDTTYDLEMARNAGVCAVGVLSGSHGADDLAPFGPLALLESVADIPRCLAGD